MADIRTLTIMFMAGLIVALIWEVVSIRVGNWL